MTANGEQVAQRMLALPGEAVAVDGASHLVRSSVGIASAPAGSVVGSELLHRADVAMYRAKAAGKGQVRVWGRRWSPPLASRSSVGRSWRPRSRAARFSRVPAGGRDRRGDVVAVEELALAPPAPGLVRPASFMTAAEACELVADGDRVILERACAGAAAGAFPAVHVNVAAVPARIGCELGQGYLLGRPLALEPAALPTAA